MRRDVSILHSNHLCPFYEAGWIEVFVGCAFWRWSILVLMVLNNGPQRSSMVPYRWKTMDERQWMKDNGGNEDAWMKMNGWWRMNDMKPAALDLGWKEIRALLIMQVDAVCKSPSWDTTQLTSVLPFFQPFSLLSISILGNSFSLCGLQLLLF